MTGRIFTYMDSKMFNASYMWFTLSSLSGPQFESLVQVPLALHWHRDPYAMQFPPSQFQHNRWDTSSWNTLIILKFYEVYLESFNNWLPFRVVINSPLSGKVTQVPMGGWIPIWFQNCNMGAKNFWKLGRVGIWNLHKMLQAVTVFKMFMWTLQ